MDGTDQNASFPTTQWSLLREGTVAIQKLFVRYRPVMLSHLRRGRRVPPAEVEDVVQGFVTDQWIQRNLLAVADRTKGRFRTFLRVTLNRYASKYRRRLARECAGVQTGLGHSFADHAEAPMGAISDVADRFDAAWAREVLNETIKRMAEYCDLNGRHDVWEIFSARLLNPLLNRTPAVSYSELRKQLDLRSPAQAAYLLATGKRMCLRMLRGIISEYVVSEEAIDEEIDDLIRTLAQLQPGDDRHEPLRRPPS